MQIRQRLKINSAIMILSIAALIGGLAVSTLHINSAMERIQLADEFTNVQYERLALRTDYMRSGTERAREQTIAKNQQIYLLLKAIAEKFTTPEDQQIIAQLMRNQETVGIIFRAILSNRQEVASSNRNSALASEAENRLVSQLNAQVYEAAILGSKLQESSNTSLVSAINTAGTLGVVLLLLVSAAILVNSTTMSRAITSRIVRLREGAVLIGEGSLDHRIGMEGNDEFAELSAALDNMAQALSASNETLLNEMDERKRSEEGLRESEARFALLSETAGALLVTKNPQALMEELCRKVMLHLDCGVFFNFMVDEEAGRLRLNACAGIPEEEARKIEWLDYGVAVCGCVARDRLRLITEDIGQTPDARTELVKSYGVQAYCCHPLMAGERLIGTLSFGATRRSRFSAEDVDLMKAVSHQVSMAMERIQREEALKMSEERYRSFVQASSQVVWTTNARGEVVLDIPAWRAYTGQSAEEAQGFGWMNAILPEDREKVAEAWRIASDARTVYEVEYLLRRHDGVWRNVLARGVPVFEPDGSVREYVGTCIDITESKQAEAKLRESEERLNRAQEIAHLGSWELDLVNNELIWSDEVYRIFGLQPQEFGATYEAFLEAVHPEDREAVNAAYSSSLQEGRDSYEIEHRVVRKSTGEVRHVEEKCAHFRNESGKIIRSVGMVHDITERKKSEEELKLAALVYQDSSEAMLVSDKNNNIIATNRAFAVITGYEPNDVIGKNPRILKSNRHDPLFYRDMWEEIASTGRFRGEIWNRKKDGEYFAAQLTVNTILDDCGDVHRYVGLLSDITSKKQSDDLIWQQANYDALTGLPNRRLFRDRLIQEVRNSRRTHLPFALMFLDLDGFKDVNDTLGHDMGDILLKSAAERLNGCVRETDTVARLGGDEFTVILTELHDSENVDRIAQHILRTLSEPFLLDKDMAYVSVSIGITLYPQDAASVEDLIKNADQAMYAAKQEGKNRYHYFTPSMQEAAINRMRLVNDLRSALESGQFEIVYQPIVAISSGNIMKAEALIRWNHPTRGLINPIEFISAAEDTGMIASFGSWIFHEAARKAAFWREKYCPEFQISVNLSPVQFRNEGIDSSVWLEHLKNLGMPGRGIVVEITEGLLLEANSKVQDQLLMLRDAGIEVSLDDFGTGYSSLSYIKKFDIDYIKIDQSFVRNLTPESDDMALCEAMIVMAHKLGIKVIAEGVETQRQHELLANGGCDFAQGYLFSKPVRADELEELLKKDPFSSQNSLSI